MGSLEALANGYLEKAISQDEKRNYEAAVGWYTKAIEVFMDILKLDIVPDAKAALEKRVASYLDRAELLKQLVDDKNAKARAYRQFSAGIQERPLDLTPYNPRAPKPSAPPLSASPGASTSTPPHTNTRTHAHTHARRSSANASAQPHGTRSAVPAALGDTDRKRALLGTVELRIKGPNRTSNVGSGSVLSRSGFILTNQHVTRGEYPIFVSITTDPRKPPETRYLAETVVENKKLDLALIRVVRDYHTNKRVNTIDIEPIPIGNSDDVEIGQELSIIGFPGIGGGTVTFTRGIVSGFINSDGPWMKTDAEINPGNSGGTAVSSNGRLVGVPSAAQTESSSIGGKLGLIRPMNAARPLLEYALKHSS
eukprot:Rmarinus@m.14653